MTTARLYTIAALGIACSCSAAPSAPQHREPGQARSIPHAKGAPSKGGEATSVVPDAAEPESLPQGGIDMSAAEPLAPETGKRIAAVGQHVMIMPEPFSKKGLVALGNIRMGTSVKLKSPDPIMGSGCERGYYAIEPRGYVCHGTRTTLNLADPYYLALRDVAPKRSQLMPYRYAHSCGAPMYSRVPTPEEWAQTELELGKAGTCADLGPWAKGHEELIEHKTIVATDTVPWYFKGGKRQVSGGPRSVTVLVWKTIPNGSLLAYNRAFEMHGRVWLVTSDLTVVPADRVKPFRTSDFHGVELKDGIELPIAWNRFHTPCPIYREKEGGGFEDTGETLGGKKWLMVVDKPKGPEANPYFELKERPGHFLSSKHITISRKRKTRPPAMVGAQKWMDAHITPGTLTAYDGDTPVYATLFSPGKGGHPVPGNDHSRYATTQTGYFRFEWKEAVATMSNEEGDPKVLWFSDVPRIQYIRAPLAMHVAYWHEDFGNPKSAECVNLSPGDGRFFFGWTDPKLPEDWGAVRPGGGFGQSTPIMINGFWVDI